MTSSNSTEVSLHTIKSKEADTPLDGLTNKRENPSAPPETSSTEGDSEQQDDAVRNIHGFKWVLVCASLYVGALVYGLDTTISADIQSAAAETLGHIDQLTWLGTGFPLGSVCAILPAAALYSLFDMKLLFILSMALFEAGSALCGAAPTMNALIVGRVIAGVGGILNYFSICTTQKERGAYVGGIGLVWGLGAILGPVVGGSFSTSSATWRWSFYINLVVAAICALVYIFYLPSISPTELKSSVWSRLRTIDWIGVTLTTGTAVTFCMALTFAGTAWTWGDYRTIVMFVVFGVLLAATVVQQWFLLGTTSETRMFPPGRLLHSRTQLLLNLEMICADANLFLPLYYIPNYFQFVHGDTAIEAAVRLLPFIMLLITSNMAFGLLLPKFGYYMPFYLVSGILMTAGGVLLFTVTIDTPAANVYGYSVLIGVGSGLVLNAGYTIAGIKAALKGGPATDVQSAISLQNLSQLGGTMVALLISGQIFQSYAFQNLKAVLGHLGFTDAEIHSAVSGTQSAVFKTLSPEVAIKGVEALTKAISKVYILAIVAAVLSVLGSLTMKRERLFGIKNAGDGL